MTQCLFSRRSRSVGVCSAIAAMSAGLAAMSAGLAASPALAGTTQSGQAPCSPPDLSQPFLSAGDANWYMLTPGQTVDNFDAGGWTLSGGARIVTTQLADGQTGDVLDLPSGSNAVSPTMCVQSGFQAARTMVRDVTGAEGVSFSVSYDGTNTAENPQNTGQVNGNRTDWTLSNPVNVQPSNRPGWQHVRFTFIPGGNSSDFQIYNFWVDPRMSH
jgi:hypothetical protein